MESYLVNYVHPDYPAGVCVYCGETGNTVDHLLPRGFTGEADRLRVPVVPACGECNSTLGDVYMPDVMERREYVQDKYRVKYKKYKKVVYWGESDLKEFGPQLRTVLRKQMAEHTRLISRLSWPKNPTYDADAWGGAWEELISVDENDLPSPLRCLKSNPRGTTEPTQETEKDPQSTWDQGSVL